MLRILGSRMAALCLALTLALALAACGPGVGGSGTGATESALPLFGASAAALCSSDLAAALDCPTVAGSAAPPGPGVGTATVYFADTIDGRRVLVRLQGNTIDLDVPCAGLQFSGEWGVISGQAARFFGYTSADTVPVPAALEVRIVGSGLQLTLRDAAGRVLLGPVLVTRTPVAGTPGGCG